MAILKTKRQEITSVGEDVENRELLVGMQIGATTVENNMELPLKIKNRYHTKGNNKQNEMTAHKFGENICKWCDR